MLYYKLKSSLYQNTKLKKRHYIARPFRLAGLSRRELRSFNFPVSSKFQAKCLDTTERNKGDFYKLNF